MFDKVFHCICSCGFHHSLFIHMNKIVPYSLGPLPLYFHQYSFICKAFTLFLNVVLQHYESRLFTVTAALLACLLALELVELCNPGCNTSLHWKPAPSTFRHPNQRAGPFTERMRPTCWNPWSTASWRFCYGKRGEIWCFRLFVRDKGPARSWKRFHFRIHDFYPPPHVSRNRAVPCSWRCSQPLYDPPKPMAIGQSGFVVVIWTMVLQGKWFTILGLQDFFCQGSFECQWIVLFILVGIKKMKWKQLKKVSTMQQWWNSDETKEKVGVLLVNSLLYILLRSFGSLTEIRIKIQQSPWLSPKKNQKRPVRGWCLEIIIWNDTIPPHTIPWGCFFYVYLHLP